MDGMKEFTIERKLSRTAGGLVLRIPQQIVDEYDLKRGDFVVSRIRVRESGEHHENTTEDG